MMYDIPTLQNSYWRQMEKDLLTIDQNTISINGRLNDKRLFVQPKVLIYFDKEKKM